MDLVIQKNSRLIMSWFEYGTPKRRSLRKGVFLRVSSLPLDILKEADEYKRCFETIEQVKILEILPDEYVLLEFWSRHIGWDPINRSTVFTFRVKEDPKWICEGDLGRGYKE